MKPFKKGRIPHNKDKGIIYKIICKQCGNTFEVTASYKNQKFCKRSCYREYIKIKEHAGFYGKHHKKHAIDLIRIKQLGNENMLGKHHSEKTKKIIGLIHKGNKYNLGKKLSELSKIKISESQKMRFINNPELVIISKHNLEKNRKRHRSVFENNYFKKGHKSFDGFKKGHIPHNKGKVFLAMEKNPNWRGGISFEEYPPEFNTYLKDRVRELYYNKCQSCGMSQIEHQEKYDEKLIVHHIDYDKKNCRIDNLIPLCGKCNSKVNYNREKWIDIFSKIVEEAV